MRTARMRISGEKRFDFLFMAPSSQSLEPPQYPGRFKVLCQRVVTETLSLLRWEQRHVYVGVDERLERVALQLKATEQIAMK